MPGVSGTYAGDIARLYYSATVISEKSEANLEAAITDGNRIGNLTEPGEIVNESTNITYAVAGEDFSSSIPGQRNPGTYDFTIAIDWNQAIVTTLANDSGRETHTWIVQWYQSETNFTLAAFDGRVGTATITGGVGEVVTLNLSIFRIGGSTIVQNT